jgi:hypothetical protein
MEVNEMDAQKKVTDFIKLEEGNIGRKSAVVTGAVLASTVIGAVLTQSAKAGDHCDGHDDHLDGCCEWHLNGWHTNCIGQCHTNNDNC